MMKVLERKRGGSFQRLVLMHEKTYEELRSEAPKDANEERAKQLVEKYIDPGAQPGLTAKERISLFNQAVARDAAARQFPGQPAATAAAATTTAVKPILHEDEEEEEGDHGRERHTDQRPASTHDAPAPPVNLAARLPEAVVPEQYAARAAALKTALEASGSIGVDQEGRVYIDSSLVDADSSYERLMRSLFVQSNEGTLQPGRRRFLEHLAKLGITPAQVSAKSAKTALKQMRVQLGGRKRRRLPISKVIGKAVAKEVRPLAGKAEPPGERQQVLLMYR